MSDETSTFIGCYLMLEKDEVAFDFSENQNPNAIFSGFQNGRWLVNMRGKAIVPLEDWERLRKRSFWQRVKDVFYPYAGTPQAQKSE